MTYKVIKFFTDLQDNEHPYNEGDIFPRSGVTVTAERFKELSGSDNRRGISLIEAVEETDEKPKKKRTKKTAE